MKREKSPLFLAMISVVVLMTFAVIGWNMLESLPSRYLSRLPVFVQNAVIPEPESAVLPDVAVPVDTSALLQVDTMATPTLVPAAQPTQDVPTAEAVAAADTVTEPTEVPTEVVEVVAEPTITPLPSPTPLPTATPASTPMPETVRITNITHHQQDWNNCGPATLAMGLSVFGETLTQYDTAAILKPNAEDRNVAPNQMADFVNEYTNYRALERVNGNLDLLKTLLSNDFPVIIEIGLDPPGEVAWLEWYGHYLLAVGYDNASQDLWVFDSLIWDAASLADQNSTAGRSYPYQELLTYWPQFNNTYVVLYPPEREAELAALMGEHFDDTLMWQASLERNQLTLQNQPDNPFFWFNLGQSYNALGEHENAVAAFDKARSIGLPWRMLWYQFGPYEAYYNQGRYVDIVLLANTTLQGRPYFEESFYWRGQAQLALGDTEAARADFKAAADFNPYYQPAIDALSQLDS